MYNSYQTSIHFPLRYITRITLLVPSPKAAIHQHAPKTCWVRKRWLVVFRGRAFFVRDGCVHVITSGYKHVF